MKLISLLLLTLSVSSVFAGENKLEMKKEGLYIGRLDNGQSCSIEVFQIDRSFIRRKLEAMKVEVRVENYKNRLNLVCGYNMENGTSCQAKNPSFSILLFTRTGYHSDYAPGFHFTYRGKTESCSDLLMAR